MSFSNQDKIEYRAVKNHFFLKALRIKKIKIQLDGIYGESTPSYVTVTNWIANFKRDRSSIEDAPCSDHQLLEKFIKVESHIWT